MVSLIQVCSEKLLERKKHLESTGWGQRIGKYTTHFLEPHRPEKRGSIKDLPSLDGTKMCIAEIHQSPKS